MNDTTRVVGLGLPGRDKEQRLGVSKIIMYVYIYIYIYIYIKLINFSIFFNLFLLFSYVIR